MADAGLLVDLRGHGLLMVAEETREGGREGFVLLLRRGLGRLLSLALYLHPSQRFGSIARQVACYAGGQLEGEGWS